MSKKYRIVEKPNKGVNDMKFRIERFRPDWPFRGWWELVYDHTNDTFAHFKTQIEAEEFIKLCKAGKNIPKVVYED